MLGDRPLPRALAFVLGPIAENRTSLLLFAVIGGMAVTLLQHGLTVLDNYVINERSPCVHPKVTEGAVSMRVLVIGGAGYVGSHTVRLFLDRGHEVWVYDNLSAGHEAAVPRGGLVASALRARELLGWELRDKNLRDVVETAWNWHRRHSNGYED